MKAITRVEQLLSGIELTPITRLETYIAYLNGQNVITPSPVTREEQILSGQHLTPVTRKEMFMLYGMGNLDSVPVPITREEHFWYNWSASTETEVKVSGILPLHLTNSVGADLVDWMIEGNTVQDGTPTPENPVEVKGVGDYDASTGMYKVSVACYNTDRTKEITAPIYLQTPLMANERLTPTSREVKWRRYTIDKDSPIIMESGSLGKIFEIQISNARSDGVNFISNKLKTYNSYPWTGVLASEFSVFITPSYIYFNVGADMDSVDKVKEFLSNNPVTVWYQLAVPTTEPVETASIGTLDGDVWLDIDTDVRPSYVEVTYLAKDAPWVFVPYTFNSDKYVIDGKNYGFRTTKDKVDAEFQAELLSIMEEST